MQLEINEYFRTNVSGTDDALWRWYPPYGDSSVNDHLVRMIRGLAAFVWKIQTGEYPPEESTSGDINLDGSVDILDVIMMVNCIMGSGECNSNMDINQDENIDLLDIINVINIS